MNKEPNFLIKFWDFLTLKTFHKNLLTSGGSTYLTVISFIMILAALSEGFAWGFLGSTFTPQVPYFGWMVVGGFVFLLMWFFDRSMASADLLKSEHEKTLNGLETIKISVFSLQSIQTFTAKYFQFFIRVGIVCLSLYITAPFLTQLVFKADIENKMMEQYKDNIALARKNGLESRDRKIMELETLISQTNDKLQKEIGGKSGTGYGYGSVAHSIERQLATLESDLKALRIERESFLQHFDKAVDRNNEEELKKFGITISKASPIFRQQAIEDFKHQLAFEKTSDAVHVFLVILGVILISAKLMQPRTLQMYFSSRLQEKWALYKSGAYDRYLPEQERSEFLKDTMRSIPEEFEQIMVSYAKDQQSRKKKEIEMLQEQEHLVIELKHQQMEDERRQLLKSLQEQQRKEARDAELRLAEQLHLERLAKEKAEIEIREKARVFYENQILAALNEVEEAEAGYLAKFSSKIGSLESSEQNLVQEVHDAERTYKNHGENISARIKRIESAHSELKDMQELASKLQRPEENHTIESLRAFSTVEKAVVDQKNYIKNMQTSLLSFDTDQKYHQENLNRLREQLQHTQGTLKDLKRPLDIIISARAQIEARKMQLLGEQGLVETPYAAHDDKEIPLLVEKLRQKLSTDVPMYLS